MSRKHAPHRHEGRKDEERDRLRTVQHERERVGMELGLVWKRNKHHT